MRKSMPEPIFIVGCPRSGTSLLRNLLRSHPRLSFPGESHFIPVLYRAFGDPASERAARGLAATILRLEWVRRWGLDLGPDDFGDCRSYRAIVSRLFEAWMRREGKARWGDKTPQYVSHIATLSELFPGCQILHIHRDGRDVALSLSARGIGPQNVYAAARFWKARVSEGRNAGARLPSGHYHELGYGSLLADPERTMSEVCGFLGERFDPRVLQPSPLSKPGPSRFGPPSHGEFSTQIVRSAPRGWKQDMTLSDRRLFESVAGELLETLGYEREGARPVSSAERLAWRIHDRSWFFIRRFARRDESRWLSTDAIMRWAGLRRRLRSRLFHRR
jgi:hypothetical protein